LHQVDDLFELNIKLWCQKVKHYVPSSQLENPLFWGVTQRRFVVVHRCFRTAQIPKRRWTTINLRCV